MDSSFSPLTAPSVTTTPSPRKRPIPQQERKATYSGTVQSQHRLDLNRLERPLVSTYTSNVVPSSGFLWRPCPPVCVTRSKSRPLPNSSPTANAIISHPLRLHHEQRPTPLSGHHRVGYGRGRPPAAQSRFNDLLEDEFPTTAQRKIYQRLRKHRNIEAPLLACTACSVRQVVNDLSAAGTKRLCPLIARKFTAGQVADLHRLPEEYRPAVSHYQHGQDFYHVHQDLVIFLTARKTRPSKSVDSDRVSERQPNFRKSQSYQYNNQGPYRR